MLKWAALVLLVAAIVCFRLVEEIGRDYNEDDRLIIIEVIDGDTVRLKGGDRLRLANIDAPEEGEPFHEEATRFLESLVLGKTARIEFAHRRRDKYGRLLGYLHVDSVFVGREIVKHGLAYILLFKHSDFNRPQVKQLLTVQRQAMESGVGLWSLEHEPEDHYLARFNRFRFHRPGCRSVVDMKPGSYRVFKTREEALYEGLTPCRRCRP